jgi:hypothetical protein
VRVLKNRFLQTLLRQSTVTSLVLFAVFLSIGSTMYTTWYQHRVVQCQNRVNQEFLATLKARSQTGNLNTYNINQLIQSVFTSAGDAKKADAAYQTYLTELKVINARIEQETYPALGSCG